MFYFHLKEKSIFPTASILVFALLSFNVANAQSPTTKSISVDDAITTALKNNLELQSQQLNVQSSTI
jgi:cobalt-zinc-cadmium resistance protein CzcA